MNIQPPLTTIKIDNSLGNISLDSSSRHNEPTVVNELITLAVRRFQRVKGSGLPCLETYLIQLSALTDNGTDSNNNEDNGDGNGR